jgi:hypothetical protein
MKPSEIVTILPIVKILSAIPMSAIANDICALAGKAVILNPRSAF